MDNNELLRRAEDLCARCSRSGRLAMTGFLTPSERYQVECWAKHRKDCEIVFSGGGEDCERTVAFFLPENTSARDFRPDGHICAMELTAHFGAPGHRDYMGAILAMGVGREWVGDIIVDNNQAYVYCLPSVLEHLLSIDKAGRCTVTARRIALSAVPDVLRNVRVKSFSVMSERLDAVTAGMFDLSRTEAAKHISAGSVSLNYVVCLKTDTKVGEGDIISLRGMGKGKISGTGGTSRKGRLFVYADIYE